MKCDRRGSETDWVRLRYARHFSRLGSATEASHAGDLMPATNVRTWPFSACHAHETNWSNPLQISGQIECRRVGKYVQLPSTGQAGRNSRIRHQKKCTNGPAGTLLFSLVDDPAHEIQNLRLQNSKIRHHRFNVYRLCPLPSFLGQPEF